MNRGTFILALTLHLSTAVIAFDEPKKIKTINIFINTQAQSDNKQIPTSLVAHCTVPKHEKKSSKTGCSLLRNNVTWACWKETVPLAALTEMPHATVVKELIQELHAHYQTMHPHSELARVYATLQDIKKELLMLSSIKQFYSWIEYTKMATLLPYSHTYLHNIEEKISRLNYVQHLLETAYTIQPISCPAA